MQAASLGVATRRGGHREQWPSSPPTVSVALFQKFQKLIYCETGIWLGSSKTALLCGRLSRRLRALELSTLEEYFAIVSDPAEQKERSAMIDVITTNETRFFREPAHFSFLERRTFPAWKLLAKQGIRARNVRVWSAGCSSGEEAYSIAMLLAAHLPAKEGWDCRVLATDISCRVITAGQAAIYDIAKSIDIPTTFLRQYMLRGNASQAGKMKVVPEIRQMVEFRWLNLSRLSGVASKFDLIFCRNVLIYFDLASKRRAVEALLQHLAPEGVFFSGHAESLHHISTRLQPVLPTVYAMRDDDSIAPHLRHSSS